MIYVSLIKGIYNKIHCLTESLFNGRSDTEFTSWLFKKNIHTKCVTIVIFHVLTIYEIHNLAMKLNISVLYIETTLWNIEAIKYKKNFIG